MSFEKKPRHLANFSLARVKNTDTKKKKKKKYNLLLQQFKGLTLWKQAHEQTAA